MAVPITLSAAMSLDNAVLVLAASKASGASDLGVLGVYQWAFSSWTPSAAASNPSKYVPGVKLFPSAIDTGQKEITKKPNVYHWCQRQRQKTVHQCQRHR